MLLKEFFSRIKFCKHADRIGPDLFWTHWRLHFKSSMRKLCKRKFKSFADTADFRPGAYAHFTSMISMGERVVIRPGSVLGADSNGHIIIENDVLMGMNVHIYADNHKFDDPDKLISEQGYEGADVVIKKGAWIGANVTILAGVTVGENAVVGAGAVVTKDIESHTVSAGVPAKVIRRMKG